MLTRHFQATLRAYNVQLIVKPFPQSGSGYVMFSAKTYRIIWFRSSFVNGFTMLTVWFRKWFSNGM